jgi:hypothetical protein
VAGCIRHTQLSEAFSVVPLLESLRRLVTVTDPEPSGLTVALKVAADALLVDQLSVVPRLTL